jgi:hypothetical protein
MFNPIDFINEEIKFYLSPIRKVSFVTTYD